MIENILYFVSGVVITLIVLYIIVYKYLKNG